jgi:hypothetical protein
LISADASAEEDTLMQIVETTISESTVALRLTEDKSRPQSGEWIAIQLKLGSLEQAGLVGDPKTQPLADVHRAALRRARDAIDAEIQRLET